MKQKTAVDWLVDNLKPIYPNIEEYKLLIALAKDKEQEQIENSFDEGHNSGYNAFRENGEQYYNKIYKQD